MDLLETTLKVVENRTAEKEHLSLFKENVEQYENYINQLKQVLQEIQTQSSNNTEILELNNYTKSSFNDNSKQIKLLFGSIYDYVQQLDENLSTISQRENILKELSQENEDRLKKIEAAYGNFLKEVDVLKKDINETYLNETNRVQKDIAEINLKIKQLAKKWDNLVDKQYEQHKDLNAVKVEMKLLEDNIDEDLQRQQKLVEEKTNEVEKYLDAVNVDLEMNEKIIKTEGTILQISTELKKSIENKCKLDQKRGQLQKYLDELIQNCSNTEKEKNNKANLDTQITDLTNKLECKKHKLVEKKSQILENQNRGTDITQEIEHITNNLNELDVELAELQTSLDNEEIEFTNNNNLNKIIKEHEILVQSSDNLLTILKEKETEIQKKRSILISLKNTQSLEKLELEDSMKLLEIEIQKEKLESENENEAIELRNKILQQAVEDNQIIIKNLNNEKQKLEEERNQNQNELKQLMLKCDNIEKELKRVEATKNNNVKALSKPQTRTVRNVSQNRQATKRSFTLELESDSSVDGERLSYAEFMAKRKILRESKKQKK